jgi:hypothetical protein
VPTAQLDAPGVAPAVPRPTVTSAGAGPAEATAGPRRVLLPVLAAGLLAVTESLGLLAMGLAGLDRVVGTALRPSGGPVALTLLLLAGWVVLCAGGGASLVDGAGRTLVVSVACGELVLLVFLAGAGLLGADGARQLAVPLGAPLPACALLALAVPFGKLLLAGAPSSLAWVAAGPRPRVRRPAVAPGRPVLRRATVGLIGVGLTLVALLGSPADPAAAPAGAAVPGTP